MYLLGENNDTSDSLLFDFPEEYNPIIDADIQYHYHSTLGWTMYWALPILFFAFGYAFSFIMLFETIITYRPTWHPRTEETDHEP